jgi:UDP-GlcNAc3NAcA epimerase
LKICTVVGARPQFIKAAAVSRIIRESDNITEVIIHTGQHYDDNMSGQFFEELDIPKPTYQLNIGSGTHGVQTGRMLADIEGVLLKEKPDCLLIYGDTNSTLAGALAASKLHIPVAHVEAGLRSFNRKMPEEINRVATDHMSDLLFTPSINSKNQLLKEGTDPSKIFNVGDVMYDATLFYNEKNAVRETIVDKLGLQSKSYALATIHRADNTDCSTRLKNIVDALIHFSKENSVILPLHPRTRTALEREELLAPLEKKVKVIEPVGYLDMLALEKHAMLIITDSGGVQKEAYFNQVPCITLRDETEWVELLEKGHNVQLSPAEPFSLSHVPIKKMNEKGLESRTLYGDGFAVRKIVSTLKALIN